MYPEDNYEMDLSMSACQALDVMGMQPHSREYLEYEMNLDRSLNKARMIARIHVIDGEGIQHSGKP